MILISETIGGFIEKLEQFMFKLEVLIIDLVYVETRTVSLYDAF